MAAKPTSKAATARALAPTAKASKFLRHCARMGKTSEQLISSGACRENPFEGARATKPRPVESVVFSGTVKENFPKWEIPPVFVIADGITIDVSPRENDAMATFRERRPGTFTRVVVSGEFPRVIASALR